MYRPLHPQPPTSSFPSSSSSKAYALPLGAPPTDLARAAVYDDFMARPTFPRTAPQCMTEASQLFDATVLKMTTTPQGGAAEGGGRDLAWFREQVDRVSRYLRHMMDKRVDPDERTPPMAQSFAEILLRVAREMGTTIKTHPETGPPLNGERAFAEYRGYACRLAFNVALIRSNAERRRFTWEDMAIALVRTWPRRSELQQAMDTAMAMEEKDDANENPAQCAISYATEREIRLAICSAVERGYTPFIYEFSPIIFLESEMGPLHTFAAARQGGELNSLLYSALCLHLRDTTGALQFVAARHVRDAIPAAERELLHKKTLKDEHGRVLPATSRGLAALRSGYAVMALPYTSDADLYASPLFTFLCSDALLSHIHPNLHHDGNMMMIPHAPLGITAARAMLYLKKGTLPRFIVEEIRAAATAFTPEATGTLSTELWWWPTYMKWVRCDEAFPAAIHNHSHESSVQMRDISQFVLAMLMDMVRDPGSWSAQRIARRAAAMLVWFMARTGRAESVLTQWCGLLLKDHAKHIEAVGGGDDDDKENGSPFRLFEAACCKAAALYPTNARGFRISAMREAKREKLADQILDLMRPNPGLRRPASLMFKNIHCSIDGKAIFRVHYMDVETLLKVFHTISTKLHYGELPHMDPLAAALHAIDARKSGLHLDGLMRRLPSPEDLAAPDEGLFAKYWLAFNRNAMYMVVFNHIMTSYMEKKGTYGRHRPGANRKDKEKGKGGN